MRASKVVLNVLSACFSVLVFVAVVFLLVKVGMASYDLGYRLYTEPPVSINSTEEKMVQIDENMSASEIGTLLEENGLVNDGWMFALQMKVYGYEKLVQPGLYSFSPSQTAEEMMEIMAVEPEEE